MSRRFEELELLVVNAELRAELRRLRRELDRLRVENEALHEAAQALIHQAPARERFVFVHRLRNRFAVKHPCRILVTDRRNYYLLTRVEARRRVHAREERELPELIMEVHTANPAYGVERVTRELKLKVKADGRVIDRCRQFTGQQPADDAAASVVVVDGD